MMGWLLEQLGFTAVYIVAAVLVAAGGYVAFVFAPTPLNPVSKLLHYVGIVLISLGLLLAFGTYEQSIGAVNCEARWKAADNKAALDKAQRELKIAQDTAAQAQKQAADLQQQTDALDHKASEYEKTLTNRAVCALTADDLARLRSIR